MSQLLATKDYGIFKKLPENRIVHNEKFIKILMNSMTEEGGKYLVTKPIIVNENLEVIDGQHRLEAAKRIGFEVYYIIMIGAGYKDLLQMNQHRDFDWVLEDWLHCNENIGKEDYKKLDEFIKETGKDKDYIIRFFVDAETKANTFKSGNFKFPEKDDLEKIRVIIENYTAIMDYLQCTNTEASIRRIAKSRTFQKAVISMLKRKDVLHHVLIAHIRNFTYKIQQRLGTIEYHDLLIDIYNFKNRQPHLCYQREIRGKKLRIKESRKKALANCNTEY